MAKFIIPADVVNGFPAGVATELHTGQSCSIDMDGTTLQRAFRVAFTAFDSTNAARASQIPPAFMGTPHPYSFTGAWVNSVSVSQMESSSPVYLVTVGYTNKKPPPFAYDSEVPIEEQPFWFETGFQYSFIEQQIPMGTDIYGIPIVNTAGDLFDPPPEIAVHDLAIKISKNVPFPNNLLWGNFSMSYLMDFLGTVHGAYNSGPIGNALLGGFEIAPYHGYIQDISADLRTAKFNDVEVPYMDVSVNVVIKRTILFGDPPYSVGFRTLLLSEGFQHLEDMGGGNFEKVRAVDDQGENTSDPVLLGPDGTKLPVDPQNPQGYFLLKELYPYSDFRLLFGNIFGITQP